MVGARNVGVKTEFLWCEGLWCEGLWCKGTEHEERAFGTWEYIFE
jgi:hypothetical protein